MPLVRHGLGYGGKRDPARPTKKVRPFIYHIAPRRFTRTYRYVQVHKSTYELALALQEWGRECDSRKDHGALVSLVSGWSAIQTRAAATDILL